MCSLKKHEKKVALPLARHISKGDHKTQGGTNRKNQMRRTTERWQYHRRQDWRREFP